MAPPRVKQSCVPCRQRKSRCNAEIPCSSCLLRGTEADCELPSGSTPLPKRKTSESSHRARSNPYPTKPHRPRSFDTPALEVEPEPSPEEKDIWRKVLDTLPPRASCEILLEYLLLECDWLHHAGDVLKMWDRVIRRGAVDRSTAGYLYISLAIPGALLGDHGSPLYRPAISRSEPAKLASLAYACVPERPVTMMDFDLITAIWFYEVYTGTMPTMTALFDTTLQSALEIGLFDESTPPWANLNGEERSERRRIGWALIAVYRIAALTPDPLAHVRFNLCRPSMTTLHLKQPIALPFTPRPHVPGDVTEERLRILRIRSRFELDRVAHYRQVIIDLTDLIPRAERFLARIGQVDTELSLNECELVYREIQHFRLSTLPSIGFGPIPIDQIDTTDIVSCRCACQALVLQLALNHIAATILRYWLEFADVNASTPSPQKRLYLACLDNARATMDTLPVVRALVSSRLGPFIVPFIASNLFNAATTFAIPVLRAVRYWSSLDTTKDIASLPHWPDACDPRNRAPLPASSAVGRLPPAIYTDSTVKESAMNILVILDALTVFNANPLGQSVARKLNGLITHYGIRDVTKFQNGYDPSLVISQSGMSFSPVQPQTITPVSNDGLQPNSAEQSIQGIDVSDDMTFINSLLQMDQSIWEGLLQAGALTDKDGQPVV